MFSSKNTKKILEIILDNLKVKLQEIVYQHNLQYLDDTKRGRLHSLLLLGMKSGFILRTSGAKIYGEMKAYRTHISQNIVAVAKCLLSLFGGTMWSLKVR